MRYLESTSTILRWGVAQSALGVEVILVNVEIVWTYADLTPGGRRKKQFKVGQKIT